MICPHCGKNFKSEITQATKRKIHAARKKGYTCREIANKLGGIISFASVSRILREKEKQ